MCWNGQASLELNTQALLVASLHHVGGWKVLSLMFSSTAFFSSLHRINVLAVLSPQYTTSTTTDSVKNQFHPTWIFFKKSPIVVTVHWLCVVTQFAPAPLSALHCYFYICSLHIVRFTCVWEIALFKSFVLSTQWLVNQTIIFWGTKEFGQLT